MKSVEVTSLQSVAIDGVSVGCVVDAINNYRDRSAEIHDALIAWGDSNAAAIRTACQGEAAEAAKQVAATVDDERQTLTAQLAAAQDVVERLKAFGEQTQAAAANWSSRYQEAADANQKLSAKLGEQDAQIKALKNLVMTLMGGTSEAAVAAMQEWHRIDLVGQSAAIEARKAALTA
jgi:chromosome segregation ATPase